MSKLENAPYAFTYDDFFLAPVHSSVRSRKDPDVSVALPGLQLDIPILSSPMNTITEEEMTRCMRQQGAGAVLHRYLSIEDQVAKCRNLQDVLAAEGSKAAFFVAIGATGDFLERAQELTKVGVNNFCIDVANGHNQNCIDATTVIRSKLPRSKIMAGNVCTYDGAVRLASAGATSIRVGIGPGSMCTTRIVTGHGIPQLTALEDCAKIRNMGFENVALIADGGIRNSGDLVKSLAIGADAVILGSLLAGTKETPGEFIEEGGRLYKYYAGMASEHGRASWFDRGKTSFIPEGVSTKVPFEGKAAYKVVENLIGGLRSGMSYANATSIQELRNNAKWMRVTAAGYQEGTPHGKRG